MALTLIASAEAIAPPPPPLSPARQALAEALAAVRQAQNVFDVERAPAEALHEMIEAADAAERKLAALVDERERLIIEWIETGRVGEPPIADAVERRAEAEVQQARAVAAAARRGLPAALNRHRVALAALHAAAEHRDAAVAAVAAEAAGEVIRGELLPAIEKVLRIEVRVQSLQAALFAIGASPAGNAAQRVADLLRQAKSEAGIRRDDAIGRAFLNAVAADPAAKL